MSPLRIFLCSVLTAVLLITLVGFLGGFHWFPDLFSHFRLQYAAVALLLLPATLFFEGKRWTWILFCLVVFALNFSLLWPYLFGRPVTGEGDTPPIRVLAWNTSRDSVKWDEIETLVRAGEYDIVLLQETSASVREQAWRLSDLYTHWVSGGFVVQVRHELLPTVPGEDDASARGAADAGGFLFHVTAGAHTVAVLLVHLTLPISADTASERATQIDAIVQWSNQQESPHLVVGDLNMTPWSGGFRDLVGRTRLRDTMVGFGLQSTWPFQNGFAALFQIPVDHCLVGPGLFASQRRAGPAGASNHRPLQISLVPERVEVR